jgi:hypothetical protein
MVGMDSLKDLAIAFAAARTHGDTTAPRHYCHSHEIGRYCACTARTVGKGERTYLTAVLPLDQLETVWY